MKNIFAVLLIVFMLFSCDGTTGTIPDESEETVLPEGSVEITSGQLEEGVQEITSDVVFLSSLEAEKMYAVSFSGSLQKSAKRYVSSSLRNIGNGTYLIIPDEKGEAVFSLSDFNASDALVYELPQEEFTSPEDLVFVPKDSEILYYDEEGRPVYQSYFYIDLKNYKKYGIEDPDRLVAEVLRTGDGGGLSGTQVFDNSGYGVNTHDIDACSSLDAVKIYFSLHRSLEDLDVTGTEDDNLKYEVMLKTPLELKAGVPAELNSPAYYIVPQSDKAAIITIELNDDNIPEGFMYQLHEILGTTVDGTGSYDVRYFFPLGYNENGDLEIYVEGGQPEFWFNYYLSSPQGLCRKDDIGSISWRELSEEESAEIEDSFVTFNVSEEKSKTIQLDPDSRRFIPVIFEGNNKEDLKGLKISADSFDAVSNIRVVAFSEKGYSGQSIHNGKPSFDFSSENDQELELTYAYIEPRRYSSGNNSVTLSVEKV